MVGRCLQRIVTMFCTNHSIKESNISVILQRKTYKQEKVAEELFIAPFLREIENSVITVNFLLYFSVFSDQIIG